jgi:hypothetical protein
MQQLTVQMDILRIVLKKNVFNHVTLPLKHLRIQHLKNV